MQTLELQRYNFKLLTALGLSFLSFRENAKSKAGGFMDLNMDLMYTEMVDDKYRIVFALSHYAKHPSGDLVADPDMALMAIPADNTVEALSYQDMYIYRTVYNGTLKDEKTSNYLNRFLSAWLHNCLAQGHYFKHLQLVSA